MRQLHGRDAGFLHLPIRPPPTLPSACRDAEEDQGNETESERIWPAEPHFDPQYIPSSVLANRAETMPARPDAMRECRGLQDQPRGDVLGLWPGGTGASGWTGTVGPWLAGLDEVVSSEDVRDEVSSNTASIAAAIGGARRAPRPCRSAFPGQGQGIRHDYPADRRRLAGGRVPDPRARHGSPSPRHRSRLRSSVAPPRRRSCPRCRSCRR